jgi:hypothetical protein
MDYFFEWLLDRLSPRLRSRLWDVIEVFLQDDETAPLPDRAPSDTPGSGSPLPTWTPTGVAAREKSRVK